MADRLSSPQDLSSERTPIPHWHTPGKNAPTITRGSGATVWDAEGSEYLDFLSQLYCVNAGHDNEAIIDAVEGQLQQIPYVSSAMSNDTRTKLATRLAEITPDSLSDVFFAVSGSEANEAAVQFAREFQDAPKVLTRWRSYHGGTYGAGGLTGDPVTRTAIEAYSATTGNVKFLPPLSHRAPFNASSPAELAERAGDHLEYVIRNEGPDSIAALLTEPIGGTSGAFPAPPGYFERVRELCDTYDILLISDEVITGFGRCGEWFGIQTEGVEPDLLTFAKGVTSGYVPLAGVIARSDIGEYYRNEGIDVGQTFAGHPVGCAAGLAAIREYQTGLIENCRALAPILEGGLMALEYDHDAVGSVHGRGLLWSVEFTNPDTGEPFMHPWTEQAENPVEAVRAAAKRDGVLFGSGRPDIQVLVAPPLCVEEDEIERAVRVLDDAIAAVF